MKLRGLIIQGVKMKLKEFIDELKKFEKKYKDVDVDFSIDVSTEDDSTAEYRAFGEFTGLQINNPTSITILCIGSLNYET
jgi:hypothetical protein